MNDAPLTRQLFPPSSGECVLAVLERAGTRPVANHILIRAAWPDRVGPADREWAMQQLKTTIYRLRLLLKANNVERKIITGNGEHALIYCAIRSEVAQ